MVASCNHWSSDLRRWGKVRMENLGNHIHHGIKHIQPVNCSALNMTKCQSFRKFWHWELFRWDLLCNLTHQVYCAWLIKWVVKREKIELAKLYIMGWWFRKWYQLVFGASPASQACLLNFRERDLRHGVGMFVIVYFVHFSKETVKLNHFVCILPTKCHVSKQCLF